MVHWIFWLLYLDPTACQTALVGYQDLLLTILVTPSQFFFHHRNAVDVGQVIKETYRLMETTPEDIHPECLLSGFEPLTPGQYPVFNKYPQFIVDYQVRCQQMNGVRYVGRN